MSEIYLITCKPNKEARIRIGLDLVPGTYGWVLSEAHEKGGFVIRDFGSAFNKTKAFICACKSFYKRFKEADDE